MNKKALIVIFALAFSNLAFMAQAMELKLSHQWKQGSDGRDLAARAFIREVEKRDPSFKFRVYPGASLIANPIQQLDALQQGAIEMSIFPLVYAAGKAPEFSATILPGAVSNLDAAAKLKGSEFHRLLQDLAHANGIHLLTWWWTEGGFINRVRPIDRPESVKALKMRGADKTVDLMLSAAGASVFSMPSTELYGALQSGILDGIMSSLETFLSMRLYEQAKFATLGGDYSVFMLIQPLVIAKSAWDKLSPEQQRIFEQAAVESEGFFRNLQNEIAQKTTDTFTKAGVLVRQLSKSEHEAWVTLAERSSWAPFEKISPTAQALAAALKAH